MYLQLMRVHTHICTYKFICKSVYIYIYIYMCIFMCVCIYKRDEQEGSYSLLEVPGPLMQAPARLVLVAEALPSDPRDVTEPAQLAEEERRRVRRPLHLRDLQ